MTDFQVGEEVIVVGRAPYVYTKAGSKGKITAITSSDYVEVSFYFCTGGGGITGIFDVAKKYLAHLDPNYVPPTKQELLCEKVKQMYARRKAKGYAF